MRYKYALLMAVTAISSSFLLTYSSILNLKYTMDHYKTQGSKFSFKTGMNYLMLTCFGILTTVIPMQFLEILKVFAVTLISLTTCFSKKSKEYVDKVSDAFDQISRCLTELTS